MFLNYLNILKLFFVARDQCQVSFMVLISGIYLYHPFENWYIFLLSTPLASLAFFVIPQTSLADCMNAPAESFIYCSCNLSELRHLNLIKIA